MDLPGVRASARLEATVPLGGDLYRYPRHAVGVRVRATMGWCDVPSLPTRMIGRSEDLAAPAEVFGRVVAGRGAHVVVTGESACAPAAPPHDAFRKPRGSPSSAFGARSIA
jgi:hypothetical protein